MSVIEMMELGLQLAQDYLTNFATAPGFIAKLQVAFADTFDPEIALNLAEDWAAGNFQDLPSLEIVSSADINGANGAFASATNTIYLSAEFIGNSSVEAIADLIVEEIGHWLDKGKPSFPPYPNLTSLIYNDPFVTGDLETRSFDGTGNNPYYPDYGATNTPLLDKVPPAYSDGYSTPTGEDRPNPRVISNTLSQQEKDIFDPRGLTNMIWAFGQFMDHDLDLTPELSREEAEAENRLYNIPVPAGDPDLDPDRTGKVIIEVRDTVFIKGTGNGPDNYRQLPNVITSWLDLSSVYGSDEERSQFLRSFQGGQLKTSEGDLLPYNDGTLENDNPREENPTDLYVAGDVRVNENAVLASLHTLFMREHNRIAIQLAQVHQNWSDDRLFQRARQLNIAQYQAIIYNEYLPSLLGEHTLSDYFGYDPEVNPGISRTFSTAAFRFGHSQLSPEIPRLTPEGTEVPEGHIQLAEAFFQSGELVKETNIGPIIRGITSFPSQKVDNKIIDAVRNLLFGFGPNAQGRDLATINIQRGRLNGLADYNTVREYFGLHRVQNFAQITSDRAKQVQLKSLYGNVNNIDPWVGMLAEDLLPRSSVGPTIAAIIKDQFERLRDGDRFYYENQFTPDEVDILNNSRLSAIVRHNTDTYSIQDNAFSLINYGTDRDDVLKGGLGDDTMSGAGGKDLLSGYFGNDDLNGGWGSDFLDGGDGDDLLNGEQGDDRLEGGPGGDAFKFGKAGIHFRDIGKDWIEDFEVAEDMIWLSQHIFSELSPASISFAVVSKVPTNSDALILYHSHSGDLTYNPEHGTGGIFAH